MAGVKMTSLASLPFILSFFLCVSANEPVPVLLWQSFSGSSFNSPSSALKSQSNTEFSDVLLKRITDSKPLVLVFGEQSLSVEDFTWLGAEGERPFAKLEKLYSSAKSRLYIPDVSGPLAALHNLNEQDYTVDNVQMGDDIPTDGKRIVFVDLDSAKPGESRFEMLKRHDSYITSTYSQLLSKVPKLKVLALYTGLNPSWNYGDLLKDSTVGIRRRRAVVAASNTYTFLNGSNKFFLYSPSQLVLTIKDKTFNLSNPVSVTGDVRPSGASKLVVRYPAVPPSSSQTQVTFVFLTTFDGSWNLSQVNVNYDNTERILSTEDPITAPLGFSYHCPKTEIYSNEDASIKLINPQIQPYVVNGTFGTTYDCVYYFTISIICGLLVTLLLIVITTWGLTMIMDINTMDRFDDPKGKPLFINAQD